MWNYPIPLGNMQFGEVVEAGREVSKVSVGQSVFTSGPFQPFLIVEEAKARDLPGSIPWQTGMLLDPAEFALGAVRDGSVRHGDRVAVFGLGAIGLVTVQTLRASGAALIVALDPIDARRQVASRGGADLTLDPSEGDVGLKLRKACGGIGPDVIIDFSGSVPALQAALRGIAYGGTIVCGAFPPPHTSGLDFGGEAHMNRPRIVFSRACSDPNPDHPRWSWARIQDTTELMIARGDLDGTEIVDPPFPFAELKERYPEIATNSHRSIKMSVSYS